MSDAPTFNAASQARIAELLTRYPVDRKQAALIPVLYVAQDQFGWLRPEVLELVARELGVPLSQVLATAMFYTMLRKQPFGRYHVQICTNVACYLMGCDRLVEVAQEELGIHLGETTPDGAFTLEGVQCLAACDQAPAMQMGKHDKFKVTPDQLRQMLRDLKATAAHESGTTNEPIDPRKAGQHDGEVANA
jgi:NADH-quinone oxidoreductase E subunit